MSATCKSTKRKAVKPLTSKGRLVTDAFYGDYVKGVFRNTTGRTYPASSSMYFVVRDKKGDIVGGVTGALATDLGPGASTDWYAGQGNPAIRSGSGTLFATPMSG